MNTFLASARRRLALLLAALAAVLAVGAAVPGSASASISPTSQFYAECSPSSVTTYSPDMRYWLNYGVSWTSTLYVWTSAGWAKYGTSRVQTAYGQNLLPAFSVWQEQEWATWSGLPRGRYYQARITAGWFGASSAVYNNVTVHHQTAQGNFTYAAYSNSTSDYCYVP
jgi:hypothetical protein